MPDRKYCYPDSEVLINKLNIEDAKQLFEVEKQLTFIRLQDIFEKAVMPHDKYIENCDTLNILTSDDLIIGDVNNHYDHYDYEECNDVATYDCLYEEKIKKMNSKLK